MNEGIEVSENSPYKPYDFEGNTFVSMMERFTTPAGLEFDAHRNTSQEILKMRADALDRMSEIIHDFEPDTAITILSEQSYEYTSSDIVKKTENLKLKADVARIWIAEMILEGKYARAVDSLLYGGVPEADIPEMQNADFVGGLLQKAQEAGDTSQAYRIANTVVNLEKNGERNSLFKRPIEGSKFNEEWGVRERSLYEKGIQETLARAEKVEGFDWDIYQDVEMAYQGWNFREDGYYSDTPHPLAIETARAYCKLLDLRGIKDRAYQVAVETKLPYADLMIYESKLPEIQQIKARLQRHFAYLSEKMK